MSVRFTPNGFLDVATEASDLPGEIAGKVEISGAMRRCKNLRLDRAGMAVVRDGSVKKSSTAMTVAINKIVEMSGKVWELGSIAYMDESSMATSLASTQWSAIVNNAYNETTPYIFALNGTNRKRMYATGVYEWGIAAPSTDPSAYGILDGYVYHTDWEYQYHLSALQKNYQIDEFTVAGGYLGTAQWEETYSVDSALSSVFYMYAFEWASDYNIHKYGVVYTYARYNSTVLACESNPSDPAYTDADSTLYVTWTAAAAGTGVTHVRVYRTLEDAEGTYYYCGAYAVGDLAAVINVPEASLGSTASTDHDRPPLGTIVVGPDFNGVCFIAYNNFLYYCLAKQPEYWPALYYVQVSPYEWGIKALAFWNGFLYALTENEIYQVQGTGANSFFPIGMGASAGAKSQESVCSVPGVGIFHWWDNGVYLFNGRDDVKITEEKFGPIFRGTSVNGISALNTTYLTNCIIKYFQGKVYFFYPGGTATYCNRALVTDIATKKTVYYEYAQEFTAVDIDYTNRKLLAVSSDYYCWQIESTAQTDDGGTAISWEIESKAFSDQLVRYFPRYARYDVELETGSTATGYVLLEDTSVQSHTIASRTTTKRLITSANGVRLGIRISGSGPAKVYAAEVE